MRESYSVKDVVEASKKIASESFITAGIDADIRSDEKGIAYNSEKAKVKWTLELEYRNWGIHGVVINIDSVSIVGIKEFFEEDREEDFELEIDKSWNISTGRINAKFGDDFAPSEVSVDLDAKTVTVEF